MVRFLVTGLISTVLREAALFLRVNAIPHEITTHCVPQFVRFSNTQRIKQSVLSQYLMGYTSLHGIPLEVVDDEHINKKLCVSIL